MKIRIALLLVAANLAFASSIAAQCHQFVQGEPTVSSIAITPAPDSGKAGNPVVIKATLTNNSNHDISIWRVIGEGEYQYQVDVRDVKGNLPQDTKLGKKLNGHVDLSLLDPKDLVSSGVCFTLAAGKSVTYDVNVSKLYELTMPGKYTIQVQSQDPESFAIVKSNVITVTLTN